MSSPSRLTHGTRVDNNPSDAPNGDASFLRLRTLKLTIGRCRNENPYQALGWKTIDVRSEWFPRAEFAERDSSLPGTVRNHKNKPSVGRVAGIEAQPSSVVEVGDRVAPPRAMS